MIQTTDYYLITLDEVNDLAPASVDKKRMEILLHVMQRKYVEKTALQAIGGGLVKGIVAVVAALDTLTEPSPKKGGKQS